MSSSRSISNGATCGDSKQPRPLASDRGAATGTRSWRPCSPSTVTGPPPSGTCFSTGGCWSPLPCSNTTIIATTGSPCGPPPRTPAPARRRPAAGRGAAAAAARASRRRGRPAAAAAAAATDSSSLSQLREQIFPTIYAAFQQCRGGNGGLCSNAVKVRNRTLRSLTRSCLYHRKLEQLERTQRDAEELLERLCRRRGYTHSDPPSQLPAVCDSSAPTPQ